MVIGSLKTGDRLRNMKIRLKSDSKVDIVDTGNVVTISNLGEGYCYIINAQNELQILNIGRNRSSKKDSVRFVTDIIDEIILHHSKALSNYQDAISRRDENIDINT